MDGAAGCVSKKILYLFLLSYVVDRGARIPVLWEHCGNVGHKIGNDFLKFGCRRSSHRIF